ncbi:MAG: tetratricopeptide repeat protein [Actinomycetes bacterium]
MSLPPLPKNFARAVDLSGLGKAAEVMETIPGIVVNQENLINEILPQSNTKVVILICWSPRSTQAISLLEVMGKFEALDTSPDGEKSWVLGTVNVDAEPQVAQALQVQSVPLAIAVIQEQIVPLFESVPPEDQIRQVIAKVISLAADRGVGATPDGAALPEVPMEPEEEAAMNALAAGDFLAAKAAYEKWLARKPGDNLAKLGLAQTELIIRITGLDAKDILAKAALAPNDLALAIQAADLEIANGDNKSAFDRLIKLVKILEDPERKSAREHLLQLFSLVDPQDPDLIKARQQLASALY